MHHDELHRVGEGEPLVLVHGLTGTWRAWLPVLDALAAEHEVTAITLPGHHGGSDLPPGPADARVLGDALERRLDAHGIGTAHLVGNSLGGLLAVELARRGRARSVVALSPAGAWASPVRLRVVLTQLRAGQRLMQRHGDRLVPLLRRPGFRRLALRGVMEHGERVPASAVADLVEGAVGCAAFEAILEGLPSAGSLAVADAPLPVPVRVAWSEHDRTIPFEHFGRPFLAAVPGAEHVTLPRVGHVPMYDDPALVARTILEVTRRARSAPSAPHHRSPTPMSTSHDLEIQGVTGPLATRVWAPPAGQDPRFLLVLAHGFGEHGGRYEHVARRLVAEGGVVVAPDHRGHGRTTGGERAVVEDVADLVADFAKVVAHARERHPDLPLVVLGHSMGGIIATRFAQTTDEQLAALVLSGPAIGGNPQFEAVLAMPEFPEIPIDPAALSRDASVGEAYMADELVYHGAFPKTTLEALFAGMDAIAQGPGFGDVPVLWIHGELDPLAPLAETRARVEALKGPDFEEHVYPGAMHEVFNETNQDEVLDDLVGFLARVLAPDRSAA
ncbi:MAG TPA: alpha/beta fold hydrolase [Baekduia sp.]|nr:alpha/beta fold hydrolase [Baekduia sp.]